MTASSAERMFRRTAGKLASQPSRGPRPRTYQKVRRNSRHRGERERTFWRPVDPLELRAIIEAAEREFVLTKEKGKRIGTIGRSDIAILRFFAEIVDWADGTLEPAYTYIKYRTGLSIQCIADSLRRLCREGFLERLRRTQPVADDGSGRTVEQIENAYRILVPARWSERVRQRVAQWKDRALRAGQRWREGKDDDAARRQHKEAERLRKTRAWAEANISDPARRADFLDELAKEQARFSLDER
jgi:hypothetical protein